MKAKVLSGIDRLDVLDKLLAGRRVGLVVGGSSIDRNHELAVDILCLLQLVFFPLHVQVLILTQ